jgi:6,7-dimethyl-8-ribityllumazine synthase
MQGSDKGTSGELTGEGLSIGIVRARFNDAITSKLAETCLAELQALGVSERDISTSACRARWKCRSR